MRFKYILKHSAKKEKPKSLETPTKLHQNQTKLHEKQLVPPLAQTQRKTKKLDKASTLVEK